MTKRSKPLPLRKPHDRSRDEESLLLRSAESLGRMIGTLQRQLDGASKRLSATADDVMEKIPDVMPLSGRNDDSRRTGTKKKGAQKRTARAGAARKASGAQTARRDRTTARKGSSSSTRTSRSSKKR